MNYLDLDYWKRASKVLDESLTAAIREGGGEGKIGYALFLFPFGEAGWTVTVSNAHREDLIRLLAEWVKESREPEPVARG